MFADQIDPPWRAVKPRLAAEILAKAFDQRVAGPHEYPPVGRHVALPTMRIKHAGVAAVEVAAGLTARAEEVGGDVEAADRREDAGVELRLDGEEMRAGG